MSGLILTARKAHGRTPTKFTRAQVAEFSERLDDAYSTDRYGGNWRGCIRALAGLGLDEREIEAVIRSKWTRWAADVGGKPYGRATSTDLLVFMSRQRNLKRDLAELVAGTF